MMTLHGPARCSLASTTTLRHGTWRPMGALARSVLAAIFTVACTTEPSEERAPRTELEGAGLVPSTGTTSQGTGGDDGFGAGGAGGAGGATGGEPATRVSCAPDDYRIAIEGDLGSLALTWPNDAAFSEGPLSTEPSMTAFFCENVGTTMRLAGCAGDAQEPPCLELEIDQLGASGLFVTDARLVDAEGVEWVLEAFPAVTLTRPLTAEVLPYYEQQAIAGQFAAGMMDLESGSLAALSVDFRVCLAAWLDCA